MLNDYKAESAFLVTNASGRHINLLNDDNSDITSVSSSNITMKSGNASAAPENVGGVDYNSISPLTSISATSTIISPQQQPQALLIQPLPVDANNDNKGSTLNSKRKYHCTEPGCTKSFTTSGHLARHNRIHTGEKNFPCLFPGCSSRFSRQDNMMQHYRTHMSPKSKRTHQPYQKRLIAEDMLHPRPKLHAHHRIRSDPYQSERPLTIDQHLNNYRRSLLSHPPISPASSSSNSGISQRQPMEVDVSPSPLRFQMPTPLGAVAASYIQKQQQQQRDYPLPPQNGYARTNGELNMSIGYISTTAAASTSSTPANATATSNEDQHVPIKGISSNSSNMVTPINKPEIAFYQYQPLTYNEGKQFTQMNSESYPFTLLHPSPKPKARPEPQRTPSLTTASVSSTESISNTSAAATVIEEKNDKNNTPVSSSSSSSKTSLLQLAHIVSTFG
ncbi:hypothetical protein BDF20DRAFT_49319 [Mycotypha africana]|uniref:uncharacterized protein n=1 Tax=Mycotypha africana TaxID=64632 RepID=UPI0023017854|nr:uncharacterized protein BDF20DRAFT_49319 [Mycotypha africana]KAI8991541.1 hypothetical protein BDF20DRAFT_49319 [Mycotypha africana]